MTAGWTFREFPAGTPSCKTPTATRPLRSACCGGAGGPERRMEGGRAEQALTGAVGAEAVTPAGAGFAQMAPEIAARLVGKPHWLLFFSSRRRHTRFDCDWSSDVCSSD